MTLAGLIKLTYVAQGMAVLFALLAAFSLGMAVNGRSRARLRTQQEP